MKIFLDKRCIINLCFLFLYLSSAFATATIVGKHRRLLIINSYNESAPWSQELITPILLQTSPIEDITADVVHMNGTFIRNDSLYIRMENGIFERFQDKKPDYLVLLGNMAFTLRERILSEWGNIPIVLIGNEDTYAPREYYFTGRPIHISNAITSPLVDLYNPQNHLAADNKTTCLIFPLKQKTKRLKKRSKQHTKSVIQMLFKSHLNNTFYI